jgi:hypothetical protein
VNLCVDDLHGVAPARQIAFSSEVASGSHEENASNKKPEPYRF